MIFPLLHIKSLLRVSVLFLFFLGSLSVHGQFYNKEYKAKIYVDQYSEFLVFTATAENLTPVDVSLRYDFSVYLADENNEVYRSQLEDHFFLQGHDKIALGDQTVSRGAPGRVTIVLVLYDLDEKPVGQDRIELVIQNGIQTYIPEGEPQEPISLDQAAPQDGFS